MRLFVSVDLPDRLSEPLADLQDEFATAEGLSFVDSSQAHLTLKFLGDVNESVVPDLERELANGIADCDVDPFAARFAGLGVFPSLEYIRVLWLGVEEGGGELATIHETVEERTTAMGFDPEEHSFTPHVTLARMQHAGGKELVQELVHRRDPTVGEMIVEEVRLTESTLTADGPIYSTVERFPLE